MNDISKNGTSERTRKERPETSKERPVHTTVV